MWQCASPLFSRRIAPAGALTASNGCRGAHPAGAQRSLVPSCAQFLALSFRQTFAVGLLLHTTFFLQRGACEEGRRALSADQSRYAVWMCRDRLPTLGDGLPTLLKWLPRPTLLKWLPRTDRLHISYLYTAPCKWTGISGQGTEISWPRAGMHGACTPDPSTHTSARDSAALAAGASTRVTAAKAAARPAANCWGLGACTSGERRVHEWRHDKAAGQAGGGRGGSSFGHSAPVRSSIGHPQVAMRARGGHQREFQCAGFSS